MTSRLEFCDLILNDKDNCMGIEAQVISSLEDLAEHKFETVVVDPRLIDILPKFRKGRSRVLAVGSFDAVNLAALACSRIKRCELYVVPVPLSNDSFCMGRCSASQEGMSFKCKQASRVYLTLRENMKLDVNLALLGVGEAVSTICSLRESLKYNLISKNKINFIKDYFNYLYKILYIVKESFPTKKEIFYRAVFSLLLSKCYIAKLLESHEHVARSDHSIGRVLEEEYEIPHGLAVVWGCVLISSYILKQQEIELIDNLFNHLINLNNISIFNVNLEKIFRKALLVRPAKRHPLLLDIIKNIK